MTADFAPAVAHLGSHWTAFLLHAWWACSFLETSGAFPHMPLLDCELVSDLLASSHSVLGTLPVSKLSCSLSSGLADLRQSLQCVKRASAHQRLVAAFDTSARDVLLLLRLPTSALASCALKSSACLLLPCDSPLICQSSNVIVLRAQQPFVLHQTMK